MIFSRFRLRTLMIVVTASALFCFIARGFRDLRRTLMPTVFEMLVDSARSEREDAALWTRRAAESPRSREDYLRLAAKKRHAAQMLEQTAEQYRER